MYIKPSPVKTLQSLKSRLRVCSCRDKHSTLSAWNYCRSHAGTRCLRLCSRSRMHARVPSLVRYASLPRKLKTSRQDLEPPFLISISTAAILSVRFGIIPDYTRCSLRALLILSRNARARLDQLLVIAWLDQPELESFCD